MLPERSIDIVGIIVEAYNSVNTDIMRVIDDLYDPIDIGIWYDAAIEYAERNNYDEIVIDNMNIDRLRYLNQSIADGNGNFIEQ